MRDEPVAVVTVDRESSIAGNVVDVRVHAETADVTLWRRGPATLEPLRHEVGGLQLRSDEKDVADVAPLGKALAAGRHADVEAELARAPSTRRDDLALGLLATTSEEALTVVRRTAEGRRLVVRLFDELTSGKVNDDEERQAARVLCLLAQRWEPESFLQAVAGRGVKYFPFRKFGVTVADSASPSVTRGVRGGLDVKYPSRAARYPEGSWLVSGLVHLEEDELIAVRLYDEGGVVRFVPALFLLQLANAEEVSALLKALEVFSLGLIGGVGAGGKAVTAWAWADRAAVSLGVVLTTISEHRGWILQRYGETGGRFIFVVETLNSLVAFYGLGRVAMLAPRVLTALKSSYRNLRAAQEALPLSAEDRAIAGAVQRETEALLVQVEEAERLADVIPISRGQKPPKLPSAPAQPLQRFEEEVLRATGTEGREVRIPQDGEGNLRLLASNKPEGVDPKLSPPPITKPLRNEHAEAPVSSRPPTRGERSVERPVLRGPGATRGAGGEMISLYRAVGDAELKVIQSTGRIPPSLSGLEGKYFSATPEGAASYARQAVSGFGDAPYTLVETRIARGLLPPEVLHQVDRNVPAIVLPNTHLPLLGPVNVLPYMPVP